MSQNPKFKIIDGHFHYLLYSLYKYPWVKTHYPFLQRNVTTQDLLEITQACKSKGIAVKKFIFVNTVNDENELIHLSPVIKDNYTSSIFGGFITYHRALTSDAPLKISSNAKNLIKGVRYIIDHNKQYFFRNLYKIIETIYKNDLKLELLITPENWEQILDVIKDIPSQWQEYIIIDHLGKPFYKGELDSLWYKFIENIAKSKIFIKVSGGILEWLEYDKNNINNRLSMAYKFLIEKISTSRLIWGSDWPLVTRKFTFCEWLLSNMNIFETFLNPKEITDIFYRNALNFYNITI